MSGQPGLPGGPFRAVLFDLDGTLVDTAPDMVGALRRLQQEAGDLPIDYDLARSNVSNGAAGLIRTAYPDVNEERRAGLHQRFLQLYQERVCEDSRVFPGLDELLDALDRRGCPWGVVTNKPQALTDAVLARLRLTRRLGCAISGDTLPQRKPHPAPLLLASRMLGVEPAETIYVGDAARDIEAGRAAGMTTVAAAWGYITEDDSAAAWRADALAESPGALTHLVLKELG